MPWSPAPRVSRSSRDPSTRCSRECSTPRAMSGDCSWIDVSTPQVAPSIPKFASVYPISWTVPPTTEGMSTYSDVVISPATMTIPVVTRVSHATRPSTSTARIASSTASEIWSASLSGCPSVTDSEENRYPLRIARSISGPTVPPALPRQHLGQTIADRRRELSLRPFSQGFVVAGPRQDRRVVGLRAEPGPFPAHLVGHEQVQTLGHELGPAGPFDILGLGGEANQDPPALHLAELRQDVRGGDQVEPRRPLLLLQLAERSPLRTEVGDGGRHDDGVGILGGLQDGHPHLLRRGHPNHAGALGRLDGPRPDQERHVRPPGERLPGKGEAHPSGGAIPHETHRIDWLPRRPGRHHHPASREVPATGRDLLQRRKDVLGLGHPAHALVSRGEWPSGRSDHDGPALLEGPNVGLSGRVLPHPA